MTRCRRTVLGMKMSPGHECSPHGAKRNCGVSWKCWSRISLRFIRATCDRLPAIHAMIPPPQARQHLVSDGRRLVGEVVDGDLSPEQSDEVAAADGVGRQGAD